MNIDVNGMLRVAFYAISIGILWFGFYAIWKNYKKSKLSKESAKDIIIDVPQEVEAELMREEK